MHDQNPQGNHPPLCCSTMNMNHKQSRVCVGTTHHSLQVSILTVHLVHSEQMVGEVQSLKPSLLTQQCNEHSTCPLQPLTTPLPVSTEQTTKSLKEYTHREYTSQRTSDSLYGDLSWCRRSAVGKLYSTPEPVELLALVDTHHPIHWRRATPNLETSHETKVRRAQHSTAHHTN